MNTSEGFRSARLTMRSEATGPHTSLVGTQNSEATWEDSLMGSDSYLNIYSPPSSSTATGPPTRGKCRRRLRPNEALGGASTAGSRRPVPAPTATSPAGPPAQPSNRTRLREQHESTGLGDVGLSEDSQAGSGCRARLHSRGRQDGGGATRPAKRRTTSPSPHGPRGA